MAEINKKLANYSRFSKDSANRPIRQTKCYQQEALIGFKSHSHAQLPPAWIGAALGMGLALSVTLFLVIRDWEERAVENEAAELARAQMEQLHVDMLRSMEVLHSITAFMTARGQPTRAEFGRFVQPALTR
jgi:hypothetical protein